MQELPKQTNPNLLNRSFVHAIGADVPVCINLVLYQYQETVDLSSVTPTFCIHILSSKLEDFGICFEK